VTTNLVFTDAAGNTSTAETSVTLSGESIDGNSPTAFDGNYAVVTADGIFADIDGDGTKDSEDTNELTGSELSNWLGGDSDDRIIVFNDAPDDIINLSGFGAGDKIKLSGEFYSSVFGTNQAEFVYEFFAVAYWGNNTDKHYGVSTLADNTYLYYGTFNTPWGTLASNLPVTLPETAISFV